MYFKNDSGEKIHVEYVKNTPRNTAGFFSFKDEILYIQKDTPFEIVEKIIDIKKKDIPDRETQLKIKRENLNVTIEKIKNRHNAILDKIDKVLEAGIIEVRPLTKAEEIRINNLRSEAEELKKEIHKIKVE